MFYQNMSLSEMLSFVKNKSEHKIWMDFYSFLLMTQSFIGL